MRHRRHVPEAVSAGTPVTAVLDAFALGPRGRGTGLATYVRGLLGGLGADETLHIRALAPAGADLPLGVEHVPIERRARGGRPAFIEHAVRREVEIRRVAGDVFHNPGPDAPTFPRRPYVQTLLDLIPLTDPDPALAVMRKRFRRYASRYRSAAAVVAISRHVADEGITHFGLDADRLHVVHLGVDPAFTADGPQASATAPYLVMVSDFQRRKGYAEAFAVVAALADAGYPHCLVIAGHVRPWQQALYDELVNAARHAERIDHRGYVEDLAALYRGADVCLVPSRAEGFGLPAVEAMASGTPVVAFANSALPEVIGDGGLLVPDGDVDAMATSVRSLLDDGGRRAEMTERGLERARTFSWGRCAREHAEIYRSLVQG
jgi:alpha-1,3-rhamnosyl/mannosyltransferase